MNFIGYYFLTLFLLVVFSFTFWVLMQGDSKREIIYSKITTVGFIVIILWILYGVYNILQLISN
jgi:hypothetical protein